MKFGAKTMERLEASIFVTETTSTAVNICRNLVKKFQKCVILKVFALQTYFGLSAFICFKEVLNMYFFMNCYFFN